MKFDAVAYQNEISAKISSADTLLGAAESLCLLANERVFRIDGGLIDFVSQMPHITPLPRAEKFVLGVCHVRGRMLTVIDLAIATGAKQSQANRLFAFKSRDLAICASLATELDQHRYEQLDFVAEALGDGGRFFQYLT